MNESFSFIILTYNEEQNLPKLLDSIAGLNAETFVLDSGSTDATLEICASRNITIKQHNFTNHPNQWHFALTNFKVNTPWIIALDADQSASPELYKLLEKFNPADYQHLNGIYFNRKNYFKGTWIKHGGYFPLYMLKMFRNGVGYSDLNETMDHRFQVTGKTTIWKKGYLIEHNLKENQISFWIEKHNRYSDLLAVTNKETNHLHKTEKPKLFGSPNQRNTWLKNIWHQLPLYLRPLLYFTYRFFIRGGFRDGKQGILFHFLHAFWFRLLVDIKVEENRKKSTARKNTKHQYLQFIITFPFLFGALYFMFICFIGVVSPGGFYVEWISKHFNFINIWRNLTIYTTAKVLTLLNYRLVIHPYGISVLGYAGFKLVYSCLGYGIMSGFSAFALSYPMVKFNRWAFLISGLLFIQVLNTLRLCLIAIFYKPSFNLLGADHHNIFNFLTTATIIWFSYLWIKKRSA